MEEEACRIQQLHLLAAKETSHAAFLIPNVMRMLYALLKNGYLLKSKNSLRTLFLCRRW